MPNMILERELQKLSSAPIDHGVMLSVLRNLGYKRPNDKIEYMKKQGVIKKLKKGMYIYSSPYVSNIISKEIIANNIYGPSYISSDYALYYYGIIPETVYEVTSVTTLRSKEFKTDFGAFTYKHTDNKIYPIGVNILSSNSGNFMIASKEKALCDKILSIKNLKTATKKVMIEFIEDDLRIDVDELKELDVGVIQNCADISKSKKLKLLLSAVIDIKNEHYRTDVK